MALIDAYKKKVKLNYIFKAPMRASSYFALFQVVAQLCLQRRPGIGIKRVLIGFSGI